MKEDDKVKLIVEKEKYAREGVHKGAIGPICDTRNIDGQWLVSFREKNWVDEIACIPVKEEDLEVIWEAPECKIGTTVLYLKSEEECAKSGIANGSFGVICGQSEDEEYYKAKFVTDIGEEIIISIYLDDIMPIRDDEVEAYKQEVARILKRKQNLQ